MKHRLGTVLCLLLTPLVLAGLGCSDALTPMASVAPTSPTWSAQESGADLSTLAKFGKKPSITIAWAKKWIGPEGGRLDFHGFAIDVPAGAVDRVTQFSIRLPVDPHGSERVVAEFGPHDTAFKTAVAIEFPYAGTSIEGSSGAHVVWWDGSQWVGMGGAPTANGERLRTTTDHFSTYGTTDQESRVVITSGG